jgi:hypothetical protein
MRMKTPHGRFVIQNKILSDHWRTLFLTERYTTITEAALVAAGCSTEPCVFGMTRVYDTLEERSVITFTAGIPKKVPIGKNRVWGYYKDQTV